MKLLNKYLRISKKCFILIFLTFSFTPLFSQWAKMYTGNSNHLKSIYFVNDSVGFSSGFNGTIIKTVNGGKTWSILSSGSTADLYSIFFTDVNNGFAGGAVGVLLKTTNGGTSWTQVASGLS